MYVMTTCKNQLCNINVHSMSTFTFKAKLLLMILFYILILCKYVVDLFIFYNHYVRVLVCSN